VDLPQQQNALLPPSNGFCENLCDWQHLIQACKQECNDKYPNQEYGIFSKLAWIACLDWCEANADSSNYFRNCVEECR